MSFVFDELLLRFFSLPVLCTFSWPSPFSTLLPTDVCGSVWAEPATVFEHMATFAADLSAGLDTTFKRESNGVCDVAPAGFKVQGRMLTHSTRSHECCRACFLCSYTPSSSSIALRLSCRCLFRKLGVQGANETLCAGVFGEIASASDDHVVHVRAVECLYATQDLQCPGVLKSFISPRWFPQELQQWQQQKPQELN